MPDSRPRFRFDFQTKVLVSVLSIMVLIQLITIWLVNRRISYQFELEAARNVVIADAVFKNSQQIRTRNLLLRYRNVPNEPRAKAVFQLGDAKTLRFLLNELLGDLGGTLLVFTTEDGRRAAAVSRDPSLEENKELESRSAVSIEQALAGEPSVDTIGAGRRLFDIVSIPIRVGDRIVGALTFGTELDESVAQEFKQLVGCEIIFLSGDHVAACTLSSTNFSEQSAGGQGRWSDSAAISNPRGRNSVEEIIIDGEHFIHSVGRLPSLSSHTDLRYVLLASYEEPLRVLKATQQMLLLVFLLGLLVSSTVLSALVRKLTRPLRRLGESAEAVGRGDFSQQVLVTTRDEFGELAGAFNKMTANLQNSREQLERTMDALRTSENFFQSLVESLPQNIYRTDIAGRFTFVNDRFCRTVGQSCDEMLGKTYAAVFPPELAVKFEQEDQRILAGHEQFESEEEQQTPDRGKIHCHFVRTPLHNRDDQPMGVQGIFWDVTERKRAEADKAIHESRLEMSRLSGMATVATGVLHNVGNVLNSVNVSATLITELVKKSKVSGLGKAAALLQEHVGEFFANDRRGKQLPDYLAKLAQHLTMEQTSILGEVSLLANHIEHIKEIVTMQQAYAKVSGLKEPLAPDDVVEDALHMNMTALTRHDVQVFRNYAPTPPVLIDRHKVLQILINVINNAKHALDAGAPAKKEMRIEITHNENLVQIVVTDNGIGIAAENLTRIFEHGFTTKKTGHGFGLHSSALAAKEMGGALNVESEGLGRGATFILELPLKHKSEGLLCTT